MFEHRTQPLISRPAFTKRMLQSALVATAIGTGSLGIGACGYHWFAGIDWVDALLNASMILAGEGPVDRMTTSGGKVFASVYALFSGVMFLTSVAVLLSPLAHRVMHRLHLEVDGEADGEEEDSAPGRRPDLGEAG